jgi:hypothetical protein
MSSKVQIEANRRNGKRSKGPTTAEGKSASAKNALKNGLQAEQLVLLPGEDGRKYLELRLSLNDQFNPVGDVEAFLVETMANQIWRLRRVPKIEAGILAYHYDLVSAEQSAAYNAKVIDVAPPDGENGGMIVGVDSIELPGESPDAQAPDTALGLAFLRASRDDNAISTLTRYQREIEQSFYKAHGELARLQAIRKSEGAGAPQARSALVVARPLLALPSQPSVLPKSVTDPGASTNGESTPAAEADNVAPVASSC